MALSPISLNDKKDAITWRWTTNGQYSAASAYDCQFIGVMVTFPAPVIWKSSSEPKIKFFAWLVMHNMVLTADNLMKRD
jgi:hypothetical protein